MQLADADVLTECADGIYVITKETLFEPFLIKYLGHI